MILSFHGIPIVRSTFFSLRHPPPCLIADDDEAFTYNKRVNRLATIQEHYMIVKAIERGVSEEKLARALNVDIKRIKTKRTLLDGVCPEVAEMLSDKSVDTDVFTLLRKMKPLPNRGGRADVGDEQFYRSLRACAAGGDAAGGPRPTGSPEERPRSDGRADGPHGARDERAAARVQIGLGVLWGDTVLNLVVASGYLSSLIGNPRVSGYLERHHPETLTEFRAIVAATSLEESGSGGSEEPAFLG